MKKFILIIEDHPIVSESLSRIVSEAAPGIECSHAASAAKGLACLNGNSFDLIILDINLPDMSGTEFFKIAKTRFPNLKILAVTSLVQRHIAEKIIGLGFDGLVLKTSDIDDIKDGVRQILEGKKPYWGKGVKELLKGIPDNKLEQPMVTLRESEVLKLIANGLTNQEIAAQLFISTSTVDSHRKNLLLKFNAKNTATLVKTVVSKGIIDVD